MVTSGEPKIGPEADRGPFARKTLKQLLKDRARDDERLTALDCLNQHPYFRRIGGQIPPERQRPDAGVDKQAHLRVRSAL